MSSSKFYPHTSCWLPILYASSAVRRRPSDIALRVAKTILMAFETESLVPRSSNFAKAVIKTFPRFFIEDFFIQTFSSAAILTPHEYECMSAGCRSLFVSSQLILSVFGDIKFNAALQNDLIHDLLDFVFLNKLRE